MKTKFIVSFLIAFLAPIHAAMIACGFLILFDTISGIVKAKKAGETISSGKLKNSVVKLLLYQFAIITAHMVELYMLSFIPMVKIVLGAVATVEFYSIIENIGVITGRNLLETIKKGIEKKLK